MTELVPVSRVLDVLGQMNEVINRHGYIVVAVECPDLPNGHIVDELFDSASDRKWDTKGHRFSIIGHTDVTDWNAQSRMLENLAPDQPCIETPPACMTFYRAITD
jgi:hypothetical protein